MIFYENRKVFFSGFGEPIGGVLRLPPIGSLVIGQNFEPKANKAIRFQGYLLKKNKTRNVLGTKNR